MNWKNVTDELREQAEIHTRLAGDYRMLESGGTNWAAIAHQTIGMTLAAIAEALRAGLEKERS